jgi:hypothetical protein
MRSYKNLKIDYPGEVKVGQIWRDSESGMPDITILKIGKKLNPKDICRATGSHGGDVGIDVLYEDDLDGKCVTDFFNFMDYCYWNNYKPVEE